MAFAINWSVLLSRKISISTLVGDIKASSSHWIKKQGISDYKDFAWQNGYGAFSIGKSGFNHAVQYIASQKEHHKTKSFQEEYLALLQKYDVQYNEKYLWD